MAKSDARLRLVGFSGCAVVVVPTVLALPNTLGSALHHSHIAYSAVRCTTVVYSLVVTMAVKYPAVPSLLYMPFLHFLVSSYWSSVLFGNLITDLGALQCPATHALHCYTHGASNCLCPHSWTASSVDFCV